MLMNVVTIFMNFKSKIKCLFEQVIIALILFLASVVVFGVIDNLIEILIQFLPGTLYRFILHLLDSILIIGLLVVAIIIMAHIFKTRYLDYYEKIKEDSKNITEPIAKKLIMNQIVENMITAFFWGRYVKSNDFYSLFDGYFFCWNITTPSL